MGEWGGLRQRGVERRWWRADGGAQGAVQRVAGGCYIVVTRRHQLHAAGAGTDQVHAMRVDDGGRNSHANRQHKPHQHKAGELDGVAQVLHVFDYGAGHK